MKVYIMRGPPGSGKTTWIEKNLPETCEVISADSKRMVLVGKVMTDVMTYVFKAEDNAKVHKECLRDYVNKIKYPSNDSDNIIAVDNTNISEYEIAPYYQLAEAFDWSVEIIQFNVDIETCIKRNVHNVPESTIRKMYERMKSLPPWWKIRYVEPTIGFN